MSISQAKYDANSIEQLTFREGVRARVGIYLGSADHTGVIAGLLELVNNATDEYLVCPRANHIQITLGKDYVKVRDFGRGMPHGPNDFSEEVMINLLTENHSGAKFNDNAYGGKSRGLNGTGSAATCCSSDWFTICSYRDGAGWKMEFEKGIPKYPKCIKLDTSSPEGTEIIYWPSQEVFSAEPIYFDFNEICDILKEYSYFNKGIVFSVHEPSSDSFKSFHSENGLIDFAKEKVVNPIHSKPIYIKASENDIDIELIMQWTTGKEKFYLFSNGGENPIGGTPITGIRTALTNFFKKYVDDSKDIVRSGLVYICSVNLKNPIYDGQTKGKITNPELRGLCQKLTTQALTEYAEKEKASFNQIINFIEKNNKAEIAAQKVRNSILKANKDIEKNIKKKVFASDKLKDARKLGKDSILLICEGDSALGSLAQARDPNVYGLLGIRGKIINALSNPLDKVMENEEVQLIFAALGVTPNNYNSKKLRYGQIGIASDADQDGNHIALLLLSMFAELMPELLHEGRVFRLDAPTHVVKRGGKDYYFYNSADFLNRTVTGDVSFLKGIGEMSAKQEKESMFGINQRRTYFTWDNEADKQLKLLMGESAEPRREFLFNRVDFSRITE